MKLSKGISKFVILFLLYLQMNDLSAQCTNPSGYGTVTAPTAGGSVTITCNFAEEYNTVNGVIATTDYQTTSTVVGDFITIRQGTPGGTVIAFGLAPLSWTSTVAGAYYTHINTNAACGTASVCRDITLNHIVPVTPMLYSSCTTVQSSNSIIPECSVGAQIVGLELVTSGATSPIDITQIQFNMLGTTTTSEVSNINIYYTGNSNVFNNSNLFGTIASAAGTIVLNGTQTLSTGTNYFWMTYDLNVSATVGNYVDAECSQITVGGINYSPTITAPVGKRRISMCNPEPGGVSAPLKLWLSADQGTSTVTDNASINSWAEISTGNIYNGINPPTYQNDASSLFNYNPTINFDHTANEYFEGRSVLGTSTVTESAVYIVHRVNSAGNGGSLFGEKAYDHRFMVHYPFTDGTSYWHSGSLTADWSTYSGATFGNIELSTFEISQSNDTKTINTNGLKVSDGGDQTYYALTGEDSPFRVGAANQQGNPNPDFYADASIAEIIVQNGGGNVGMQRKKIESYLAIKYGITLNNSLGGAEGDYTSTNNSTVWDASVFPSYHNNVIGIGRDNLENLYQNQSHTTDDVSRIYIGTLETLNSLNSGIIVGDNSFVMMGDNQGAMCATAGSNSEIPATCGLYSRIEREWKVTKTNFSQNYNVDFSLAVCGAPGMVDVSHLRLLVDDDGDFSNGGTQCYFNGDGTGIVITYNNPVITISNISDSHILNNSTKYITIGSILAATPLPIELSSFEAECGPRSTALTWSTSSETNNDYFTIEKSINGYNFEAIAVIDGTGNSSTLNTYSLEDLNNSDETIYYRLRQTDFDGKYTFSSPIAINCEQDRYSFNLYPNPNNGNFYFDYQISSNATLIIYNTLGQQVDLFDLEKDKNVINVNSTDLSGGVYYYNVLVDDKVIHLGKFVVAE